MCDLCCIIYDSIEAYWKSVKSHWDESIVLINNGNNEIGLYTPCEDFYYSNISTNVNYCPKCGRRLK